MPQPTTKPRPSTKPTARSRRTPARQPQTAIETTARLSEDVLDSLEKGQLAAIEAVREFVARVDHALPDGDERSSRRQEIVDSALQMSERLVHTQHDFITGVINSAGRSLGGTHDGS